MMRITEIKIEGPNGEATLRRENRQIVITGTRLTRVVQRRDGQGVPVGETFELVGRADNRQANLVVAGMLEKYLDGYRGSVCDVAEYLGVIETFED